MTSVEPVETSGIASVRSNASAGSGAISLTTPPAHIAWPRRSRPALPSTAEPWAAADRVPTLPRAGAIVSSAAVLGAAAHVAAAGELRADSLTVTVMLLVLVVTGILAVGARLARALPDGRPVQAAHDASAALALVTGQALVHWFGGSAQVVAAGPHTVGGHHAGTTATLAAGPAHGQHSWSMLAAHCLAALMVGLLLRGLEHSIVRLIQTVRSTATDLGAAIGVVVSALVAPMPPRTARRLRALSPHRPLTALAVLSATVARRGPPAFA